MVETLQHNRNINKQWKYSGSGNVGEGQQSIGSHCPTHQSNDGIQPITLVN